MDIIINSDCHLSSQRAGLLERQSKAVLSFLVCLGYDAMDPPLAEILSSVHKLQGNWLVLSPIHWQATHNDAQIAAVGSHLGLDEAALKEAYSQYAQFLAADQMTLYFHEPDTWLLGVDNKPQLRAKPAYQLINHSLMPELAALDSSMYWQKFITESQMFFASHSDTVTVNGVWLWGGAALLDKKSVSVCADEPFLAVAQECSSKVTLYQPSLSLNSFQILLINNLDSLSQAHQEQINRLSASWYWNNAVYIHQNPGWLTRLWSALTHAN